MRKKVGTRKDEGLFIDLAARDFFLHHWRSKELGQRLEFSKEERRKKSDWSINNWKGRICEGEMNLAARAHRGSYEGNFVMP